MIEVSRLYFSSCRGPLPRPCAFAKGLRHAARGSHANTQSLAIKIPLRPNIDEAGSCWWRTPTTAPNYNTKAEFKTKRSWFKCTNLDIILSSSLILQTSGSKTSARFGKPFTGNQIWSHVSVALLKTLTDINRPGNKELLFGMAFPFNHEELLIE